MSTKKDHDQEGPHNPGRGCQEGPGEEAGYEGEARQSDGKLSALDAAAKVLAEAGEPMTSKAMIDAMAAKGYWTSLGGQTPHATLDAAILREITTKGAEARFTQTDRGHFALASSTNARERAESACVLRIGTSGIRQRANRYGESCVRGWVISAPAWI